jgi:hypothetical protein
MVISHSKKFVMFLPWKTASQTMSLRLQPFNDSPYNPFFYFNAYLNRVVHQHLTCAEFVCLPESRLGHVAVSFVRNPYDRVYSGFHQLQKDIREQPFFDYPNRWIRDLVMNQLSENFSQICQAGFQFDRWVELIRDEQIYEIGRNSNFPLHPSHYWTHIAGEQFVGFIGRVERFEHDFEHFLLRVGIDRIEPRNANVVNLEARSAERPLGYRYLDRMSAKSIDKINRLFEKDFEIFGYQSVAS